MFILSVLYQGYLLRLLTIDVLQSEEYIQGGYGG